MNSTTAAITPRSRRPSVHRSEKVVAQPDDPRTRVLIRVPWVKAGPEIKAKTASNPAVESANSKTTIPHLGSLGSAAIPPRTASQSIESRPAMRVDAAHFALPAPHLAAPTWIDRSKSWPIKLIQKPSTWITALFAIVVVLILSRSSNESTPPVAPAVNSVKREPRKNSDRMPVDSAATGKQVPEDRMAHVGKPQGSSGPVLASPSAPVVENSSTRWSEQPGLNRRAAANAPAMLNESPDGPSNPQIMNSLGNNPNPSSNSNGFHYINESPTPALPPVDATPSVDPSQQNNHGPSRAAWLPGTIQSLPYR